MKTAIENDLMIFMSYWIDTKLHHFVFNKGWISQFLNKINSDHKGTFIDISEDSRFSTDITKFPELEHLFSKIIKNEGSDGQEIINRTSVYLKAYKVSLEYTDNELNKLLDVSFLRGFLIDLKINYDELTDQGKELSGINEYAEILANQSLKEI